MPVAAVTVGVLFSWLQPLRLYGEDIDGVPEVYFRPDARAAALLLGCLASLLLHHSPTVYAIARRRFLGWVGANDLAVSVGAAGHGPVLYIKECIPLATVGCALLLMGVVGHPGGLLAHALSRPTLVWMGGISYGLYLWHVPAAEQIGYYTNLPFVLEVPARIGAGLPLGVVSMSLVERPFLTLKKRLGERERRLPTIG